MHRLDAVQLKVALTGEDARQAAAGLPVRPTGDEWTVRFWEDRAGAVGHLPLYERGVILRARQPGAGAGVSTVKLRPGRRSLLTARWLALGQAGDLRLRVEEDWAVDRVLVASLDAPRPAAAPPHELVLTGVQREFLAECGGVVRLDGLTGVGPVRVRRCWPVFWQGHRIAAGWWMADGGPDILELTLRVEPAGAEVVWRAFDTRLRDCGVVAVQRRRTTEVLLERLTPPGNP
ncbi:hypothetical protein GCM10010112_12940 [Actinoplanes lobatus]|uniref:CYTH domain-containing protein n=1 Tax=Actinoplanes lobatus TaxID=113568 RepID=A0A7W7HM94_9ACTN|nr:hypothetical protein [Actinoplanes lobatus]MBB4753132.1 hypothetical protein [Actinoplanes lobatus]GGN58819.1 hypothetical protein GCM10010112_12940 [Actinoplanes lobatus]GIE43008.1 hypothetical protein Alo02nite_59060 [Actinoplanes lobatus]